MSEVASITADHIRDHLLARATAFSERTKMSFSAISKEAVADDRFLARARAGKNFTIETYQRVIDWIDAREAAQPSEAAA